MRIVMATFLLRTYLSFLNPCISNKVGNASRGFTPFGCFFIFVYHSLNLFPDLPKT